VLILGYTIDLYIYQELGSVEESCLRKRPRLILVIRGLTAPNLELMRMLG